MKFASAVIGLTAVSLVAVTGLAAITGAAHPAHAQPAGSDGGRGSKALSQAREQRREQINENALFLMGGQLGAVYIAIAQDIATVVNDGDNLRILPVVGAGGGQNVQDVVFLRGIDLALTNVQTLDAMRASGELGPNLERTITYIAPLFPEEMQIVARAGIQTIADLKGKRVSYNSKGSSVALLVPKMMEALGIETQQFFMSQPDAIQKIRAGELDATICMCPNPVSAFQAIQPEWGLKFVEVPFTAPLQGKYLPATFSAEHYPGLIAKGEKIETVASTTVLISFNWPKGSARYARTAKFVDIFFTNFPELLKAPRHPLWRSVNFAASVPGWQRFQAAQEWLDRSKSQQGEQTDAAFREFLRKRADRGVPVADGEEKDRLFREFLETLPTTKR